MFTAPDIIALRMAEPFAPFRIELLSGKSIPVLAPYEIGTHLKSSHCGVSEADGSIHTIPFREIASIVPLPAENVATANERAVGRPANQVFTAPDIIALRMANPFVPFRIQLISGESVPVLIPTAIGTHLKSSYCGVAEENGDYHRIPFRDIASIVPLPAEGVPATN